MRPLIIAQESPVISKAKELCQIILDQPAYKDIRQTVEAFLSNREAVEHYRRLCDLQDLMRMKEDQGMPVSEDEIQDYEKLEQEFLNNPLAQGFIESQNKMHKIEATVSGYVRKTFELGRVPEESDFEGGGCGPGCGCHG